MYLLRNQQQEGPYSEDQIKDLYESGHLPPDSMIWEQGMPSWLPVREYFDSGGLLAGLFNPLATLAGLEKIRHFDLSAIFRDIFRRHHTDEIIDFFCAGSRYTTPPLDQIKPTWPSLWIFSRVLFWSIVLFIGYILFSLKFQPDIPALLIIGGAAFPLAFLVMFAELNIKRNIPWYIILKLLFAGAFISFVCTMIFHNFISASSAPWAAFTEEPAKLLAVIYLARKYKNGSALTGLLCGAAVGAGFAIFETFGYIFKFDIFSIIINMFLITLNDFFKDVHPAEQIAQLISNKDLLNQFINNIHSSLISRLGGINSTLFIRAISSPVSHVVWTAIAAGAFWKASAGKSAFLGFFHPRFLLFFIIPIALHYSWNAHFLGNLGIFRILLWGLIAYGTVIVLANQGIHDVRKEQQAQREELTRMPRLPSPVPVSQQSPLTKADNTQSPSLHPVAVSQPQSSSGVASSATGLYLQGYLSTGQAVFYSIHFQDLLATHSYTIGRANDNNLCIPDNTVSSHHAALKVRNGALLLGDCGSSNGTYINGSRLQPNTYMKLRKKDQIVLGRVTLVFR